MASYIFHFRIQFRLLYLLPRVTLCISASTFAYVPTTHYDNIQTSPPLCKCNAGEDEQSYLIGRRSVLEYMA
ncbi:hypothetical protein IW261DRAFT_1528187 [Armillaria novae-zelandiae]|uniref:Secreted protein n=1 Tax=Armillaria novae-zelandiae TaxID=153914 RepID=A0AA39TSD8_9AGAR|nr:hypothetical protein IW261DRAFT_1528187 [Armillaria novae-zelandiae]